MAEDASLGIDDGAVVTSLDEFNHLGIDFISFMENIDTSSPMGKAMFTRKPASWSGDLGQGKDGLYHKNITVRECPG